MSCGRCAADSATATRRPSSSWAPAATSWSATRGIRGVVIENRRTRRRGPAGPSERLRRLPRRVGRQPRRPGPRPGAPGLRRPRVGGRHPRHRRRRRRLQRRRLRRLPGRRAAQASGMVNSEGHEYELAVEELGLGYRESAFTRGSSTGRSSSPPTCCCMPGDAAELAAAHRRAGRAPAGVAAARSQRRLHLQEHARVPRLVAHRPGGPARPSHRRRRDLARSTPTSSSTSAAPAPPTSMALMELARERVQEELSARAGAGGGARGRGLLR